MTAMPAPASDIARIAIVDDESSIRTTLRMVLEAEGYAVDEYGDGLAAWDAFNLRLPDLAILDVGMPRLDGLELCRRLRSLSDKLPVLFLSSRDDEIDRVLGLEIGADDYIAKPFSNRELLARIRVQRRRLQTPFPESHQLCIGDLAMDEDRCEARWRGALAGLSVSEFRMVFCMARLPGHVKTRDQLRHAAFGPDYWTVDRTIDTHIKRIRRKFEVLEPVFDRIEAVHGLGYRWRDDS